MDLIEYRESWGSKPVERVVKEKSKLETKLNTLKKQYFKKNLNRPTYYKEFETISLQLHQLRNCLKYRSYRDN